MLAELTRSPALRSLAVLPKRSGFAIIHPRYQYWLSKCGLATVEQFLALQGEILSGHHDRHVLRVELQSRVVYLKREHRVGWRVWRRNRRAGFGSVSRSVREAMLLEHLDAHALPGPQWIAYGEDRRGRAFLLVDDLVGCDELRVVATMETDAEIRADTARQIGTTLAAVHLARIDTPDLAAKHLFLRRKTGSVTIIDWPSARHGPVSLADRRAALAQLDSSLAESLASPRERIRVLRAYLRNLKGLPPLKDWVRQIQRLARPLQARASIRNQRCNLSILQSQRLVWLAEAEAVCVTPSLAESWPQPAICDPYYAPPREPVLNGERLLVRAPDGRPALLLRWRTRAPLSRFKAWLRGKCWRSPASRYAKKLFQDQRAGQPGPRLLAFGQRLTSAITAESFVLIRAAEDRPC